MADSTLQVIIRAVDQGATGQLQNILQSVIGLDEGTAKMGARLLEATGLIIGMKEAFTLVKDAIVETEKMTAEWENTLVTIGNNTNQSTEAITQMGAAAVQIGQTTGASFDSIAHGIEHATNVTQDLASATAIATVATASAVSTGADASAVTNLLANAMHEYGLDVSTAATAQERMAEVQGNANLVMGQMHLATAESNTTLGDFTEATAKAVGIAANLGVSMTDVFAATSALTRHGFPDVYQAGTQVTDMLTHMMNPSKESKDALQELANESGDQGVAHAFDVANLASRGLVGTIDYLKQSMDAANLSGAEQEQTMNKIVPALRGGLGIAALTGTAFADMNKAEADLNDTSKTTALTQEALAKSLDTTVGQLNVFKDNVGATALSIGGPLNTALKDALKGLNDGFEGWRAMTTALGTAGDQANQFAAATKDAIGGLSTVDATASDAKGMFDALGTAIGGVTDHLSVFSGIADQLRTFMASLQGAGTTGNQLLGFIDAAVPGLGAVTSAVSLASDQLNAMGQAEQHAADMADADTAKRAALHDAVHNVDTIMQQETASLQANSDAAQRDTQSQQQLKAAFDDSVNTLKGWAQTVVDADKVMAQEKQQGALAAIQTEETAQKNALDQEKTAYDTTQEAAIRARQNRTTADLNALQVEETAQQNALTNEKRADDEATQAKLKNISDAKTSAERAENDKYNALEATYQAEQQAAQDTFNAEKKALDQQTQDFERAQQQQATDKQRATDAAIQEIEREKTSELAAIDEEVRARQQQANDETKAIDARSKAQVDALRKQEQDLRTHAEQQKQIEQTRTTKGEGGAAADLLASFYGAEDAGNTALADQLGEQLSQVDSRLADIVRTDQLNAQEQALNDQIQAVQDQTQAQKDGIQQQLQDFKDAEDAKRAGIEQSAKDREDALRKALQDFQDEQRQELQTFKDSQASKLEADQRAYDDRTRLLKKEEADAKAAHDKRILAIGDEATAETDAVNKAKQARDDARTLAQQRDTAYYTGLRTQIQQTSQTDVQTLQDAKTAQDAIYTQRGKDLTAYYAAQTKTVNETYQNEITQIDAAQKAQSTALAQMSKDSQNWATGAVTDIQHVEAELAKLQAQEMGGGFHAPGKGPQDGSGGGIGKPPSGGPGQPDGHDQARGAQAFAAALGYLGSDAYYRDGSTYCETFAEDMTGLGRMGATARDAWANWGSAQMPGQLYGGGYSLVYFDGPTSAGHVGIADAAGDFVSVLDPPWNITEEPVSQFLKDNPTAHLLGSVPLYAQGGQMASDGLAYLHQGEFVISQETSKALARQGMGYGDVEASLSQRAASSGGDTIVVNVRGSVVSERDLIEAVHTGLLRKKRSSPSLGLS